MYQVKLYKGDYRERQKMANNDDCVAYVEHHFNSYSDPTTNYTIVIVGSNASETSKNWGRWYAKAVAREFNLPLGGDDGIVVGGFGGRGDYNLRFTTMPAILLEPFFVSNPQHAEWIRDESVQKKLANILCESIQRFFQNGGLVAFSVGHKYKTSRPNDRGAQVYGGGWEADYAETILDKTGNLLKTIDQPQEEREVRVIKGDEVLWKYTLDEEADVKWDPIRGVLQIEDS